jgi:hypothetical protein
MCDKCPELECEVCGKLAVGVCSSVFGAISNALCEECLRIGREPYGNLVGGLSGIDSIEGLADWAKEAIKPTLEFYDKTIEDVFADIKRNDDDFEEYMRKQQAIYEEFPT